MATTSSEQRTAPARQRPAGALPRPDAITLACFAGVVLIAGANPIAVRFGNAELAPFWGAAIRFTAGAVILFAVAAFMRIPFPRGRALLGGVLFGVLSSFAAYAFIYVALRHVPAGHASSIMASVPLLTFFLAIGHRVERFRWRGLAGGLASAAGIVVLSGAGATGGAPVKYLLMVVAAAACAAESGIVIKKLPRIHPIMMNAIAMAVGSVLLYGTSFLASEHHTLPHRAKTWGSLAFLIIAGSVVMFVLYVTVINRWTVTGASYQFVLFPVVSVLLASQIADEKITLSLAPPARDR